MDDFARIITALGEWTWWVAAVVLLVLELVVPGVYFLWLALAAFAVALSTMAFDWSWQWQLVSFAALSMISVLLARILVTNRPIETDQPMLNRRGAALVGREFVLDEAIVNGRGRVKVADSLWRVSGEDCPAGTRIRVTAVRDGVLEVAGRDSGAAADGGG
jgi:hypothetical protein